MHYRLLGQCAFGRPELHLEYLKDFLEAIAAGDKQRPKFQELIAEVFRPGARCQCVKLSLNICLGRSVLITICSTNGLAYSSHRTSKNKQHFKPLQDILQVAGQPRAATSLCLKTLHSPKTVAALNLLPLLPGQVLSLKQTRDEARFRPCSIRDTGLVFKHVKDCNRFCLAVKCSVPSGSRNICRFRRPPQIRSFMRCSFRPGKR